MCLVGLVDCDFCLWFWVGFVLTLVRFVLYCVAVFVTGCCEFAGLQTLCFFACLGLTLGFKVWCALVALFGLELSPLWVCLCSSDCYLLFL